jgi:hypothetical protein
LLQFYFNIKARLCRNPFFIDKPQIDTDTLNSVRGECLLNSPLAGNTDEKYLRAAAFICGSQIIDNRFSTEPKAKPDYK